MVTSINTADEYELVDHNDTVLSDEKLGQIRDWLEPTDYLADSGEFRRHILSQAPGTGLWICETEEYRKWHDSPDHGSLWIKGVPGAGKSVMAASIIQHLRQTEDCPVLFFFFRNIVAANFSPRALIRDWLAQLLPHSPKLQFALEPRLNTSLTEVSSDDLIRLFIDGITCVPKLYCIGDALDEMTTDNRPFLDHLNALATHRPRSLKLLMTSRPKQHLQSALRDSSIVHISLQQHLVDVDIMSYLHHRFDAAPKSDIHTRLKKEIVDMISKRSGGLFLYSKLTMDQVESALIIEEPIDIGLLGRSLPVGLEQTYTAILAKQRRVQEVSISIQMSVLEAVTHASRPLRLYELSNLMKCIYPDMNTPQGFKTLVATSCGPLVEILEDETLQVIHHSFTEFLRGDSRNTPKHDASMSAAFPILHSDKAHKSMALHCLRYLQSGSLLLEDERVGRSAIDPSVTYALPPHQVELNTGQPERASGLEPEADRFNYREARLLHPFLGYAVENWAYHASCYDIEDKEIETAITEFLKPDSLAFRRWLVLQWGSTSRSRNSTDGIPTPLHVAAFAGLSKIVSNLIRRGSSITARDAQERLPIHWAAANGHHKVVSLLVEAGSDPDVIDGRGLKPIHLAAKKNHSATVIVLLGAGVAPNSVKTREDYLGRPQIGGVLTTGDCAVFYASQSGHLEAIIAMIPFCKSEMLEQLLCECCQFGRADAVLAILERSDVSADATYRGGTALFFSCGSTSPRCVEALIKRGANVNKVSNWNPRTTVWHGSRYRHADATPLHHLVHQWSKRNESDCLLIFRMLVKAHANIDQLDGNGRTALLLTTQDAPTTGMARLANTSLRTKAPQALLEAGADVKIAQFRGDTILHHAISRGCDLNMVRLLVEHGSNPNEMSRDEQTAFQCAIMRRMGDDIIKYFLENGADPYIGGPIGRTALEDAVVAGGNLLRLMLSNSNNPALKQQCWFQLQYQREIEHFASTLELMLAEGISIHARDREGRTLYLCCLESPDKLRVLQEHGADTTDVDNDGNNSLHIYAEKYIYGRCGSLQMELEEFIAAGADPLRRNNNGDTLLHHVAASYNGDLSMQKLVRWLISIGIPINLVNNQGRTALHVYGKTSPHWHSSEDVESCHFVHALGPENVDFEIRDKEGLAVLHVAAMKSWLHVVVLLEAGADIGLLTEDSQNVLHLACRARNFDVVGQILDHSESIDVNQRDRFGRTPLYYACMSGEAESVALLLKHGVDVQVVDCQLRTPLHACIEFRAEQRLWDSQEDDNSVLRGPPEDNLRPAQKINKRAQAYEFVSSTPMTFFPQLICIANMLLEEKVDVSLVDRSGLSILEAALQKGCPELIEVFVADDELFSKATLHLETKRAEFTPFLTRQSIKTQMALIRQRSTIPILNQESSVLDQVSKHPSFYLNLLTCQDVLKLIHQDFAANLPTKSQYNLLQGLMNPDGLPIVEKMPPQFVLRFSSHDFLRNESKALPRIRHSHSFASRLCTALQLACSQSGPNLLMLKLLVEKFAVDVNAQSVALDSDKMVAGGTALHDLASVRHWWHIEAMGYLIANGAAVNARNQHGQTPLHIAARETSLASSNPRIVETCLHLQAVRLLVEHGADLNALDDEGLTPLHEACHSPHILLELLREGADINIGIERLLFTTIYNQELDVLNILLDQGANVDSLAEANDSEGLHIQFSEPRNMYAVVYAAFVQRFDPMNPGSVPLLCALIERGANLYLPVSDKETMIHFLFKNARYRVLDALLKEPCISRINLNSLDQGGRSVLMAACGMQEDKLAYGYHHDTRRADEPPVRMLKFGADAALVDHNGMTALHHIVRNERMPEQIVLDFINHHEVQRTISVKDNDGFLPLHYALERSSFVVCNFLVSKGADLLEPNPEGLSVLHHIARRFFRASPWVPPGGQYPDPDQPATHFEEGLSLWQKFLAAGGSINATDKAGNTPLLAYLSSRINKNHPHEECHLNSYYKLFPPESDVDVFAINNGGETALHIVAQRDHSYYEKNEHDRALFEFMMAKGLDPLKEDNRGSSALDVASACRKSDILHLLGRK